MPSFELVNTGANSNDGTGDPLRTAFIKVNNNANILGNIGLGNTTLEFANSSISSSGNLDLSDVGQQLLLPAVANLNIPGSTRDNLFLQSRGDSGNVFWGVGVAGQGQGEVQINVGNRFAAATGLAWDSSTGSLAVPGELQANLLTATGIAGGLAANIGGVIFRNDNSIMVGNLTVTGTTTINNFGISTVDDASFSVAASVTDPNNLDGDGYFIGMVEPPISMTYNSISNTLVFSRSITAQGFDSSNFAYGQVTANVANFSTSITSPTIISNSLTANIANLESLRVSNTRGGMSSPQGNRRIAILETQGGWTSLVISTTGSSAANAGFYEIATDSSTGNLTIGRYTGSNADYITAASTPLVTVTPSGNVHAPYYYGNGSQLTGVAASGAMANVPYITGNTAATTPIATDTQINAIFGPIIVAGLGNGALFFDTNNRPVNVQPLYIRVDGHWRQILTAWGGA